MTIKEKLQQEAKELYPDLTFMDKASLGDEAEAEEACIGAQRQAYIEGREKGLKESAGVWRDGTDGPEESVEYFIEVKVNRLRNVAVCLPLMNKFSCNDGKVYNPDQVFYLDESKPAIN